MGEIHPMDWQVPRKCTLLSILSLSTLILSNCADYVQTNSTTKVKSNAPASWKAASKGQHAQISTSWLSEFSSPAMTSLVNEAVSNNPNLNAVAARLRVARLNTIGTTANRLPSLSGSASTSRSRNGNGSATRSINESFGLSLSASWEPDIWGQLKDLDDASVASFF